MTEEKLTFDQLPQAVAALMDDVKEIKSLCQGLQNKEEKEIWLSVDELQAYLPEHPSKPTLYRWVNQKTIPYYKDDRTRALRFKKNEIDTWLASGRRKTRNEQNADAEAKILAHRNKKSNN